MLALPWGQGVNDSVRRVRVLVSRRVTACSKLRLRLRLSFERDVAFAGIQFVPRRRFLLMSNQEDGFLGMNISFCTMI